MAERPKSICAKEFGDARESFSLAALAKNQTFTAGEAIRYRFVDLRINGGVEDVFQDLKEPGKEPIAFATCALWRLQTHIWHGNR
jgi:hypothetical protein